MNKPVRMTSELLRLTKRVQELETERDKLLEILELDSIKRVELLARLDEFVP